MITATNQRGHTIERFDGPKVGWVDILDEPFATRDVALAHMSSMARTPGAEYRVYARLGPKLCAHASRPRCVGCSQPQGEPHAAGCQFAKFTIRRS